MDPDISNVIKFDAFVVPIVMLVVQGVIGWILWSLSKRFVSSEIFTQYRDKAEPRLEKMEMSVAALDTRMGQLPSKDELSNLSVGLTKVGGEIRALQVHIDAQKDLMERALHPLNLLMEYKMRGEK